MKIIKGRFDLVHFFFLPFTLLSIFLFFFPPNWISLLHKSHWVFLFILFISLIRFGKIPLGEKISQKTGIWLLELFSIQFILNLFFWGLIQFLQHDFPVSVPPFPPISIYQFVLHTGFFPWAVMILMSVMLSYYTYYKNNPPLFSSVYFPCFQNSQKDSIGIAIDSYMRLISLMCMIFVTVFASLAILSLFQHFGTDIKKEFYFSLVIINSGLILLVSNKYWNKLIRLCTFHLNPTLIILLFSILISGYYLFLSSLLTFVMQKIDFKDSLIFKPNPSHWMTDLTIMIDFLWMAYALLVGACIAYLSQGRTVRAIIGYSFVLNLLSWGVILFFDDWSKNVMNLRGTWATLFCSLAIALLLNKSSVTYLIRASLPTNQVIKPRSPLIFMRTLLSSASFLISLYMALGVYVFSFISVLSLLPPLYVFCIGSACFVIQALRKKA